MAGGGFGLLEANRELVDVDAPVQRRSGPCGEAALLDKDEGNPRDILEAALERVEGRYLHRVGLTPPATQELSANATDRYVPAVPG